MQHLEVSGAVRPIYGSLGVERLSRVSLQTQAEKPVMSAPILFVDPVAQLV